MSRRLIKKYQYDMVEYDLTKLITLSPLSHIGAFKIPVVVVFESSFCSDQDDAAKLLLDAGADINCKNPVGTFPLKLCTTLGNYKVLRLLANHPKVNLHNQVVSLSSYIQWIIHIEMISLCTQSARQLGVWRKKN